MGVAERMQRQRGQVEIYTRGNGPPHQATMASEDEFQRQLAGIGGMLGLTAQQSPSMAQEQYRHNTGWVNSAIQVKAKRIAAQPLKIARLVQSGAAGYARGQKMDKAYIDQRVPTHFKSAAANYTLLEQHPLLEAVADPNPIMVAWSLACMTVFNLEITGKCIWLTFWDNKENRLRIWPVPTHWCEARHQSKLFGSWWIRPEGGYRRIEVPGHQVIFFNFTDPSHPLASLGTVQAQARAVLADEAVQESQRRAFLNGIWPGLKIMVGRLPDDDGEPNGPRISLNDDQREGILDAIKRRYRGIYRENEPIICDGFIEDVQEVTRTNREMAYKDSAQLTKNRVVQGFTVNPIAMGEIEGANRASAVVADENMCAYAINPMLTMMGQVITAWMKIFYQGTGEDLVAFYEECKPNNPDFELDLYNKGLQGGTVRVNEWRGKFGLTRLIGGDGVWFGGNFHPCLAEGEQDRGEPPLIPPPAPVDEAPEDEEDDEDEKEERKPPKKGKPKDKDDEKKHYSVAATLGPELTKSFWRKTRDREENRFFE